MTRLAATTEVNVRSGPGVDYEILDTLSQGDQIDEVLTAGWCAIPMEDGSIGWVSRKFLATAPPGPTPTPSPPSGEPVQVRWMRSKLGLKEVPGAGDNPEIVAWMKLTTLPPSMWHDSTAWCAVCMNAALLLNNIPSVHSAAAVDYLKVGKAVTTPQKGDIVVFLWDDGSHHVACYLEDAGGGRIRCIGGNQSDAVTITTYPKANVMGYRRVS